MHLELEIPADVLHQLLDDVSLPSMARVAYDIATPAALTDVPGAVDMALGPDIGKLGVRSGMKIAIGVGSRGVGCLPAIVSGLVRRLRQAGAHPFIVPAMGSHGGATAAGQSAVLQHLGVTEDTVGAPIESAMDTRIVGYTDDGLAVHQDRRALEADGIVFIARVKPHTAFRGPYESGLAKMIAIGFGKQVGAAATHARGFGEMARVVPAMAEVALSQAPYLFGLAVLENAHDQPCELRCFPARDILTEEPSLLVRARQALPALPFQEIDVLVIDSIGKNISGDGADPNITGRYPTPYASGGPSVSKQVVLDLSDASAGNANGIGTADFTTLRLARKVDLGQTYPNALTSTVPGPVRLPMILPSDRLAIAAAILTCNTKGSGPRLVRIADTLHLSTFSVSTALLPEVRDDNRLRILQEPTDFSLDPEGNLTDLHPVAFDEAEHATPLAGPW